MYSSPDILTVFGPRRMKLVGQIALMEEMRNAYKTFIGTLEVKRPLGKSRGRWKDAIKIGLKEIWF